MVGEADVPQEQINKGREDMKRLAAEREFLVSLEKNFRTSSDGKNSLVLLHRLASSVLEAELEQKVEERRPELVNGLIAKFEKHLTFSPGKQTARDVKLANLWTDLEKMTIRVALLGQRWMIFSFKCLQRGYGML